MLASGVSGVTDSESVCVCGHTAHWHAGDGTGDCEGVNIAAPGSHVPCECAKFTVRNEADVQVDVNIVLDTLLTAQRLSEAAYQRHGEAGEYVVIDFALDAVKRLRADAVRGVTS